MQYSQENTCVRVFFIKLQTSRSVTLLKSNSSTGVFLQIMQNVLEKLFQKTSANGCFWNLMKKRFGWSWNSHYYSELIWKTYFMCILLKSDSQLSKQIFLICFNDSPSKVMKNAFYFILKALSVLKIFKFLPWLFGHVGKTAWLEKWG